MKKTVAKKIFPILALSLLGQAPVFAGAGVQVIKGVGDAVDNVAGKLMKNSSKEAIHLKLNRSTETMGKNNIHFLPDGSCTITAASSCKGASITASTVDSFFEPKTITYSDPSTIAKLKVINDDTNINKRIQKFMRIVGVKTPQNTKTPGETIDQISKSGVVAVGGQGDELVRFDLFLELAKTGTQEQKDLAQAILNLAPKNGKNVDIFTETKTFSPNRFWTLLSEPEMTSTDYRNWTVLLTDLKAYADKNDMDTKTAFFDMLEKRTAEIKRTAQTDKEKDKIDDAFQSLSHSNCYFLK